MLLLPWFERVAVKGLADGFMADGIDHFEFHELVGQQSQAPARVAIRWLATAQDDHLGLLPRVEFALTRPHQPGLALQRLPAALMILTPRSFDGGHTQTQRLGYLDVTPAAVIGRFIGQQQGSRPPLRLRAAGACFDQLFQPEACLGLQHNVMLLEHSLPQQVRQPSQQNWLM